MPHSPVEAHPPREGSIIPAPRARGEGQRRPDTLCKSPGAGYSFRDVWSRPALATRVPMSRADALLAAIAEAPDDDAPRLVYADWLEEHGDDARAEFIRV